IRTARSPSGSLTWTVYSGVEMLGTSVRLSFTDTSDITLLAGMSSPSLRTTQSVSSWLSTIDAKLTPACGPFPALVTAGSSTATLAGAVGAAPQRKSPHDPPALHWKYPQAPSRPTAASAASTYQR